ncbi:MAG: Stp1/IreP family PP2C-type Ser/Thr phosphatase [Acidimicrobiales bacterium]
MRLKHGACTDVGLLRVTNEDAFSADAELFIVADGMGGHNAGEVASALAVSNIKTGARSGLFDPVQFRDLVQQANTAIYTASLDDTDQRGMGTTVTALAVLPGSVPRVMVANVGDSRTYIFRDGTLQPVSVDHSYVQELVNESIITRDEARVHPRRNIVTRALGIDRNVSVDVFTQEVRTGDRLLLCSDGLVDEVADADIAGVLTQFSNPQECAEALVMLANTNGGRDNTTVIVVDVADDISAPVPVQPDNDTTGEVSVTPPITPATAVRGRRVTLGMTLFWSVLVAIVLGVVTVLGAYGRTGYFIGFTDDDTVAIWRGRAGGVLWFDPTIDTETTLTGDGLPPDILRDVVTNRSFPSGTAARSFLQLVQDVIANSTTTSTTSTTVPGD